MKWLTRSACRFSLRKTLRPAACGCSFSQRPKALHHLLKFPGRFQHVRWLPWRTQPGTDALDMTHCAVKMRTIQHWSKQQTAVFIYITQQFLPSGEKMVVRESYRRDCEERRTVKLIRTYLSFKLHQREFEHSRLNNKGEVSETKTEIRTQTSIVLRKGSRRQNQT